MVLLAGKDPYLKEFADLARAAGIEPEIVPLDQFLRAGRFTPLAALDLPLKVLIWADGDQTKLSYEEPQELAARYGLSDELAGRLSAVDAVTDAVIEANGSELV